MSDFFFVVKCALATLVILVFMQMRIGNRTIEQHSLNWIQTSSAVEELRGVAEGAVFVETCVSVVLTDAGSVTDTGVLIIDFEQACNITIIIMVK